MYRNAHELIQKGVIEEFGHLFSSKSNLPHPVRLGIMLVSKDKNGMIFTDIQNTLHLSPGNLDCHSKHLKKDGYMQIKKILNKEEPRTAIYMTERGDDELKQYISKLRLGLSV